MNIAVLGESSSGKTLIANTMGYVLKEITNKRVAMAYLKDFDYIESLYSTVMEDKELKSLDMLNTVSVTSQDVKDEILAYSHMLQDLPFFNLEGDNKESVLNVLSALNLDTTSYNIIEGLDWENTDKEIRDMCDIIFYVCNACPKSIQTFIDFKNNLDLGTRCILVLNNCYSDIYQLVLKKYKHELKGVTSIKINHNKFITELYIRGYMYQYKTFMEKNKYDMGMIKVEFSKLLSKVLNL